MPNEALNKNNAAYVKIVEPGTDSTTGSAIVLLSNASATSSPTSALSGGQYIWKVTGTFSGATVTLQSLGPDGSTYQDVTSLTANGQAFVNVGVDEVLRATVTSGTPSALYSTLSKVS